MERRALVESVRRGATESARRKNIQVAIRMRPLNGKEQADGVRRVVKVNEVTSVVGVKDKSFGPFDKVFDAQTSQGEVYESLIRPLVSQVLCGYNATVFAYGQTGTGKTFTMEGEEDPDESRSWDEDSRMGIIPRALKQIFEELENQGAEEYAVRVSYVELYNEELFDLLVRTDSIDHSSKLRIYEDSTSKGSVIISGLEMVAVQNCHQVFQLLRRGREKRRTAATLMNMNSSRSHSVFTVSVITRERVGELRSDDLMRTGKLYLVDLAGSENISRSGSAEVRERTREAGNINQSLLTLGRVITSLTTGALHIPYRESKLTRILQDSLGGKTITTIIANISPTAVCVEETVNTLEYASSAKNIKNHPEVNEKVSRRGLLRIYTEEVERLKKDLQAAREKNGVFIDKENFEGMQERLETQRTQIGELTDQLEEHVAHTQKLVNDLSDMDLTYGRLYERYVLMEDKLKSRRAEIEALNLTIATKDNQIANQNIVMRSLQCAAETSKEQYEALVKVCADVQSELDATHHKLQVVQEANSANEATLAEFQGQHTQLLDGVRARSVKWGNKVDDCSGVVTSSVAGLSKECASKVAEVREAIKELQASSRLWCTQMGDARRSAFDSWQKGRDAENTRLLDSFKKMEACETMLSERISSNSSEMVKNLADLHRVVEDLSSMVAEHISSRTKAIDAASEASSKASQRDSSIYNDIAYLLAQLRQSTEERMANQSESEASEKSALEQLCSANNASRASANALQDTLKDSVLKAQNDVTHCASDLSQERVSAAKGILKASNEENEVGSADLRGVLQSIENHYGNIAEKSSTVCASVTELDEQVGKSNDELCAVAHTLSENSKAMKKKMESDLSSGKDNLDAMITQRFVRPPVTGNTPVRVTRPFPKEAPEIPNVDEELAKLEMDEPQRRQSMYRRRDSILDTPFPVLSPQTLKGNRMARLDEGDEENEEAFANRPSMSSQRSVETNSTNATNVQPSSSVSTRRNRKKALGDRLNC